MPHTTKRDRKRKAGIVRRVRDSRAPAVALTVVSDPKAAYAIIHRAFNGNKSEAERRLEVPRATLIRLSTGEQKAITEKTAGRILHGLGKLDRHSYKPSRAFAELLLSSAERQFLQRYWLWIASVAGRDGGESATSPDVPDGTYFYERENQDSERLRKTAASNPRTAARYKTRLAILRYLKRISTKGRGAYDTALQRFMDESSRRGVSWARIHVALERILGPLIDADWFAVERSLEELHVTGDLRAFLDCGIKRERLLLRRDGDRARVRDERTRAYCQHGFVEMPSGSLAV